MKKALQVALCQMTSTDSRKLNLEFMLQQLQQIPANVEVVFFPENCLFQRVKRDAEVKFLTLESEEILQLSQVAQKRQMDLHLGSVALKEGHQSFNASVVLEKDGSVRVGYRKIHLFDVHIEGQLPIRESDRFVAGSEACVWKSRGWSFGQTICYDLRFSNLFALYAHHAVDVILVPASFLVKTGQAHWEVLLRARAIESQCFVIAAAQAGTHRGVEGGEHHTFGRSMVIDPWGQVLLQGSPDRPEILQIELDPLRIEAARTQIPMRAHRKQISKVKA